MCLVTGTIEKKTTTNNNNNNSTERHTHTILLVFKSDGYGGDLTRWINIKHNNNSNNLCFKKSNPLQSINTYLKWGMRMCMVQFMLVESYIMWWKSRWIYLNWWSSFACLTASAYVHRDLGYKTFFFSLWYFFRSMSFVPLLLAVVILLLLVWLILSLVLATHNVKDNYRTRNK